MNTILTKLRDFFKAVSSDKNPDILLILFVFVHERTRGCCTWPVVIFPTCFTFHTSTKMFAIYALLCDPVENCLIYVYVAVIRTFRFGWGLRRTSFFPNTFFTYHSLRPQCTLLMDVEMT